MFVRKRYPPGSRCPHCRTAFRPGEPIKICAWCLQPHHPECWEANGGCTTYGCSNAPEASNVRARIRPRPQARPAGVLELDREGRKRKPGAATCGAPTRRGWPCRHPGGWGTTHPGQGRRRMHEEASLPRPSGRTSGTQPIRGICPYCRFPIKRGESVQGCPSCGQPHHRDCWVENGGCTIYGCRSSPQMTASTPTGATAWAILVRARRTDRRRGPPRRRVAGR